ncbi:MAG TPA: hypothetical protein VFK44_03250 [Bacillales bacterium]|nr:hypothetical protein [Bacillales bacterium]
MAFGDDTFHFIAGYTSNGFPFGITHEEMEEIEGSQYSDNGKNKNTDPFKRTESLRDHQTDYHLPF